MSWYNKVAFFTLCIALSGLYTIREPPTAVASDITYSSIVHWTTYSVSRFGVPCTFFLGMLLLIAGLATTDRSTSTCSHFASSVTFKEFFAKLTLMVGFITLLGIGTSLTVKYLLGIDSAIVGGGSGAAGAAAGAMQIAAA